MGAQRRNADAYSDPDADAYSDPDTYAYTHADAYTYAYGNTHTYREAYRKAHARTDVHAFL